MGALHVREFMTSEVTTTRRDAPVSELHRRMLDDGCRHILVVNEDGDLIGTISDRDILAVLGDVASLGLMEQLDLLAPLTAADVMTNDIEAVEPGDEIGQAAEAMLARRCSCVPVVDGKHLVGLLTETDFVRHLAGPVPQT